MRLLALNLERVGTSWKALVARPCRRSGCQDTYFVGTLKGVGRIYAQTFVDAHCSWAQAKLHLSKIPMTAVDLLHDRVLPVYEQAGVALEGTLTDHGASSAAGRCASLRALPGGAAGGAWHSTLLTPRGIHSSLDHRSC